MTIRDLNLGPYAKQKALQPTRLPNESQGIALRVSCTVGNRIANTRQVSESLLSRGRYQPIVRELLCILAVSPIDSTEAEPSFIVGFASLCLSQHFSLLQ